MEEYEEGFEARTETEIEEETEIETETEIEAETETETDTETEESETDFYDNTADATDNSSDSESGINDIDGTPDDASLLERLDALVEALTPDEGQEVGELEGTDTEENTESGISAYDSETLGTLQGIQSTLATIQAENELWHTETLAYRKEIQEAQENIIQDLEYISLLLIAVGFFTALLCGGKFADIFFKRMKGEGD